MTNQERIDKFNRQFHVGTIARVRRTQNDPYELRVITHCAFENGRREAVAGFQGIAAVHSILPEFVDYKFRP